MAKINEPYPEQNILLDTVKYTRVAEWSIQLPFQGILEGDVRVCSRLFRGGLLGGL